MTLLHVDLGTGLGGWTAPFKSSENWRSVGLDVRADLNADVVGDLRRLPLDCQPDLLTMSPPCSEFTRWMLPWIDSGEPSMELVEGCLAAVEDLRPRYWVLENSRALAMYWDREPVKRVGAYYLWGEFPAFDVAEPAVGKMDERGQNPERRAKIPRVLADALRRAVEWGDAS